MINQGKTIPVSHRKVLQQALINQMPNSMLAAIKNGDLVMLESESSMPMFYTTTEMKKLVENDSTKYESRGLVMHNFRETSNKAVFQLYKQFRYKKYVER